MIDFKIFFYVKANVVKQPTPLARMPVMEGSALKEKNEGGQSQSYV